MTNETVIKLIDDCDAPESAKVELRKRIPEIKEQLENVINWYSGLTEKIHIRTLTADCVLKMDGIKDMTTEKQNNE